MLDLDDMRAFVAVLDGGGFGRGARRLGLSKSIVSRRIARLEADLGTRLLNRTTRGVAATEAGLEFKGRAERILLDLEEARDAVAAQGSQVVGRLRLSVPLAFGVRRVAPLLAELATRHPRLEIDASFSDRLVDLISERFDAAIRIGELKDSSLIARRIAPARAAVVASPAYLDRHGRPSNPGDLANHACLIYTGSTDPDWRFQAEGGQARGGQAGEGRGGRRWTVVRPEGQLRFDNGEALLQAAIAGLGVAALPAFYIDDAIRNGVLEELLPDYPMPTMGIHVVRPPGAHVPGKVRVLIDLLAERLKA